MATVVLASLVSLLGMPACSETGAERTGAASTSAEGTSDVSAPTATGVVFFPQWAGPVPGIGVNGRLFEDEAGCIRVRVSENFGDASGAKLTVLWPRSWSADREQEGHVRILNTRGRVLARVGDEVYLGGYPYIRRPLEEVSEVDERTKRELLGRCPGGYYFVGSLEPPLVGREESTSSS